MASSSTVFAMTTDAGDATLVEKLLDVKLIRRRDWERLPPDNQSALLRTATVSDTLSDLVKQRLLTEYQAARLSNGRLDELILGNYRVLDYLGTGGMGVVLKAEHYLLRRPVAVKVLTLDKNHDRIALDRFLNEIWILGQLNHPNIVTALDAGEVAGSDPEASSLYYVVMEYVPGQNLEELVNKQGPMAPAVACELMHQIADALSEAHRHQLVHRDIKPSNILVTPDGQAKLLDFGIAQIAERRLTKPGMLLGSVAYLAPEQAQDARGVDIRADLYSLGGTLYWCLTGHPPFQPQGNIAAELAQRLRQPPPRVRQHRPELPEELEQLIMTLMAVRPEDRPDSPEDLQRALLPYIKTQFDQRRAEIPGVGQDIEPDQTKISQHRKPGLRGQRVLIVDDEANNRLLCRMVMESIGVQCMEVNNGREALDCFKESAYDAVILDIDMPVMSGTELLQRLRLMPPSPHLKIIMVSGRASADEMAQIMLAGADDYLTKPFSTMQLQARVKSALRLKDAQERSDALFSSLLTMNHELEGHVLARDSDLIEARNALVLALAELVAHRDTETGAHLVRLQRYAGHLARRAASAPNFAGQIEPHFIAMLECCTPLHDIGKAGVPDHILLKPGKLTPDERLIMQSHTTIGSDILQKVAQKHGFAKAFLKMAADITRHHHERFDGQGYPDRLSGDAIPLAARIVAVADVYDAMRSRRVYKPALPHDEVVRIMLTESTGQFDPALLCIFADCADEFGRLYCELVD